MFVAVAQRDYKAAERNLGRTMGCRPTEKIALHDRLRKPFVVVVGSLHYDIMVDAPDRPRKGETVTGYAWQPKCGGKGGNQAVAARAGRRARRMVGAVGDDDFGAFLLAISIAAASTPRVVASAEAGSGMSVAISDADGDYGAVIVSGSNLTWA